MSWINPTEYDRNDICVICTRKLGIKQAIYQGEPCKHKFHNNCFNEYCQHNEQKYMDEDESLPCPVCRGPLNGSCMDVWAFKNQAFDNENTASVFPDEHVRKIYETQSELSDGKKSNKSRTKTRKLKKGGKWSLKYKKSINCKHPKGFSQKQYCKYSRKNKK
jgi:hypothetical protein